MIPLAAFMSTSRVSGRLVPLLLIVGYFEWRSMCFVMLLLISLAVYSTSLRRDIFAVMYVTPTLTV